MTTERDWKKLRV